MNRRQATFRGIGTLPECGFAVALVFLLFGAPALAADRESRTSYLCDLGDGAVRRLDVDLARLFPLSVERCRIDPSARLYLEPAAIDTPPRTFAAMLIEAPRQRPLEPRVDAVRAARPATMQEIDPLVTQAARHYGLDARLIAAVIQAESHGDAAALSARGAVGLMQIMPATGKHYGIADARQLLLPSVNIDVGTHYLSDLASLMGQRIDLVVAAYNAGEGQVIRAGYRVPQIPETIAYVATVLAAYERASLGR